MKPRFLLLVLGWVVLAGRAPAVGADVAIDTAAVAAFGAATDVAGAIWVAAAGRDTRLRVYRSEDCGRSWEMAAESGIGADVARVEVVCAAGDSDFVYVFYLALRDAGDVRVLRIDPSDLTTRDFPVAVGPDTVTGFAVCADRDRRYFLYCLYVNETRAGRNGGFTRSRSFGSAWDAPQPWWNCEDPYLAWGGGSTILCAWRYAVNGREIHLQQSRHYGRVRTWSGTAVLSGRSQWVASPVLARSDTAREDHATVWAAWTVAARDSQRLDIATAFSTDGGRAWRGGPVLGSAQDDEWYADLAVFPGSASGSVYLAYNAGDRSAAGNTTVRLRGSNSYEPARWSSAHKMNDARAHAARKACRPRVVCPADAPRGWAGVVFAGYDSDHGAGLFFDAIWNGIERDRGTEVEKREDPKDEGAGGKLRAVRRGSGAVSCELRTSEPGRYDVAVFTADGRLAREVFSGYLAAGMHRMEWDRLDRRGKRCGAGVYIVRATGPGTDVQAKVSVLR